MGSFLPQPGVKYIHVEKEAPSKAFWACEQLVPKERSPMELTGVAGLLAFGIY